MPLCGHIIKIKKVRDSLYYKVKIDKKDNIFLSKVPFHRKMHKKYCKRLRFRLKYKHEANVCKQ